MFSKDHYQTAYSLFGHQRYWHSCLLLVLEFVVCRSKYRQAAEKFWKDNFKLNEGIQELDWFCFWATAIEGLKISPQVKKTPEQLELDQKDPKAVRLPDGLETAGNGWFREKDVEKVIVSSSVNVLGDSAFSDCR